MKRRWGIGTGLLLVGLFVLHHDFWNWQSTARVFGVPVGLAYHASYCIVVTLIFARLTRHMIPGQDR